MCSFTKAFRSSAALARLSRLKNKYNKLNMLQQQALLTSQEFQARLFVTGSLSSGAFNFLYIVPERKLGFFVQIKKDENFNRKNTCRGESCIRPIED